MRRRARASAAIVAAAAVVAGLFAACSGDDEPEPAASAVRAASTLGPGEGALNLVTLPGDLEAGGTDPRVDWVTPFEERTGCEVSVKGARDAQELTDLMGNDSRQYDGVLAPPEAAGRLISAGDVAPVNPNLVEGYKKLEPRLRDLLERNDKVYGVPYTWGSNLLMYDTRNMDSPPSSWASLFDPERARRYSGKLVIRDSPLTIAEAALYLRSKKRDLKISDPYALTREQLDQVTEILAEQRPHVKQYWKTAADAVSAFAGGEAAVGQVGPYQVDVLTRAGKPVQGVVPDGGVTGWMNAWMIGARSQHPNCMYQWLQWTASPDAQRQVAEWLGVAPANPQACTGDRLRAQFCNTYRVGDRDYLEKVIFAHAPSRDCGGQGGDDDRATKGGRKNCTDYEDWTQAWIKATKT